MNKRKDKFSPPSGGGSSGLPRPIHRPTVSVRRRTKGVLDSIDPSKPMTDPSLKRAIRRFRRQILDWSQQQQMRIIENAAWKITESIARKAKQEAKKAE